MSGKQTIFWPSEIKRRKIAEASGKKHCRWKSVSNSLGGIVFVSISVPSSICRYFFGVLSWSQKVNGLSCSIRFALFVQGCIPCVFFIIPGSWKRKQLIREKLVSWEAPIKFKNTKPKPHHRNILNTIQCLYSQSKAFSLCSHSSTASSTRSVFCAITRLSSKIRRICYLPLQRINWSLEAVKRMIHNCLFCFCYTKCQRFGLPLWDASKRCSRCKNRLSWFTAGLLPV